MIANNPAIPPKKNAGIIAIAIDWKGMRMSRQEIKTIPHTFAEAVAM